MRVLLSHNYYKQSGGEDVVVHGERDLLARHGHTVRLSTVSNTEIEGIASKLRVMAELAYSPRQRDRFAAEIADFKPDVVLSHNTFPLLTPAIFDACEAAGVPVIQTLHNYRLACVAATFLRDGKICELCLHKTPYSAAIHGCYQGSHLGSLAVARMIDLHRRRRTWHTKVDLFLALSRFVKTKMVEAGLPADRIMIKPNFTADTSLRPAPGPRSALFIGRLSPEKGCKELVEAWRHVDTPLHIAGAGPIEAELRAIAPPNVTFLGWLDKPALQAELTRTSTVVVPSISNEPFGLIVIEAYAAGIPVLASRIGALEELVTDGETGRLFRPADPAALTQAAKAMLGDAEGLARMARGARRRYEQEFTPDVGYRNLMSAIETAVTRRRGIVRPAAEARTV